MDIQRDVSASIVRLAPVEASTLHQTSIPVTADGGGGGGGGGSAKVIPHALDHVIITMQERNRHPSYTRGAEIAFRAHRKLAIDPAKLRRNASVPESQLTTQLRSAGVS